MIPGNGVPAASDRDEGIHVRDDSPLRDIQDLIAKLEVVNRQLSFPARAMPAPRQGSVRDADVPGTGEEVPTH